MCYIAHCVASGAKTVDYSCFRRRKMAVPVVNAEMCVGCGSCEAGCPAEAIKVNEDSVAVIDASACVECLACIDNCPAGAITEGE